MAGACLMAVNTSPTTIAVSAMVLNVLFDTVIASDMDIAASVILLKLPIKLDTESDMDALSLIHLKAVNNLPTLSDTDTESDIDLRAL